MLEDCYDCPEGINGKKVEFGIPLVSIEPFDFDKLHANEYRTGAFSPFSTSLSPSTLVRHMHTYARTHARTHSRTHD
jgi:hypothetical protein